MKAVVDLIARHKAGEACGMYSVCSAHPLVIEAAFRHAMRCNAPFSLIEATSNQVNQDGGYTGMTPAQFRDFVVAIADRAGLARDRILLGGDHLGPNAWQTMSAGEAMARADVLIRDYVGAGFRKIHLDCSMPCADDLGPLSDDTIAARAARLCAVAESAWRKVSALSERWARVDASLLRLRSCLAGLDGRARDVVRLHYEERRSRREIGARLGIGEHGVKSLLRRTRTVLRDCMQRSGEAGA